MLKQNAPAAASHPLASEELERPNTRVRRLSAARGPRSRQAAKVQRVLDAGLRLNRLRSSPKMHALLVEEVAKLLGALRVLLVLESDVSGPIAGSLLPAGEHPGALLQAIAPWLDEARRTRAVRLRHGPRGVPNIEQRSCLVAPLQAQSLVLGYLYADVDGRIGRFDASHRELIGMFAAQAAVALDNQQRMQKLERKAEASTTALAERVGELEVIATIQRAIAGRLDFDGIVKMVGDKLREVFGVGDLSMLWWDLPTETVRTLYNYEHGLPIPHRPPRKIDADTKLRKFLELRKPVVLNTRAEQTAMGIEPAPGTDWCHSAVVVPIVASDRILGFIGVQDHEREYAFDAARVSLLETVASSMAVALENARLVDDIRLALAHQTAAAEVLQVVSSSMADAQPVFEKIIDSCAHHFAAGIMMINLVGEDGLIHLAAIRGREWTAAGDAYTQDLADQLIERIRAVYPVPLDGSGTAAVIDTGHVLNFPDLLNGDGVPETMRASARRLGINGSQVYAPLMQGGRGIGSIALSRPELGGFSEREQALLKTFADQAVIAIQNARLFDDTRKALERQTATAEILRVISGSPTDVTPVFDAIAERARVLCGASLGYTTRFDGERLHLVGYHGVSAEAEAVMREMFPRKPDRGSINGRCLLARAPVCISDVELDPEYQLAAQAKAADFRSMLAVPMLQGGRPIGVVGVARKNPGPFADELMGLLQTFADQAAIAIENVRLFNETQEALAHQTATADILRVISESPTDVQPVFDVIAERAERLTGASLGFVFRFDGDLIHIASVHGVNPEGLDAARNAFPMPPGDGSATARAVRDGVVVNIGNVHSDTEVGYKTLELARLAGYRAVLAVPMLREREIVGAIAVMRVEEGQFAGREVDLLRTFADQAVIAIENVRLFNETKEGLRQQTAVAGVLKVISQSTFDLERVLTTLIENATQLCEASHGFVFRPHGDVFRLAVSHGAAPEFVEHIAAIPVRPERGYLIGRVVLGQQPVQILDALEDPDYRQAQSQRLGGYRTMLGVPMLSGSTVVGVIVVWRQEVRAFTAKQIELLTTFADQAAIAVENVRLFNETKEALERQTATSEVLKVISASPTDVQPVLHAVAERAGLLCKAEGSRVWLLAPGDKLRVAANHGPDLAGEDELPLRRTSVGGRAFLERRLLHVEDIVPLLDTE
ncbi:MAG: GAF domain-containing protein, partial [Burkholderiales bacterium]